MARRHEAEALLRQGKSPSEIARQMGISIKSVIQYLRTQVGEGTLRFSDIYYALPRSTREKLAGTEQLNADEKAKYLKNAGLTREELELFQTNSSRRGFVGDLYEYVSEIELLVHFMIESILIRELGDGEEGWWRRGIPSDIRAKCAARREEDDDPGPAFTYTTLMELFKILEERWRIFETVLPKKYRSNKRALRTDFIRLNLIRNAVMHPVRFRTWSEEDFRFVRELYVQFGAAASAVPPLPD